MYKCNKCGGKRIKTRTNNNYGKTITTVVGCKDCQSTDVAKIETRYNTKRRQ
jgi:hypothetical protein